ncbi:MAG: DnaD domain protein [Hespellia sp.]|nr:DnaD domain protein [Hespellia sp.]
MKALTLKNKNQSNATIVPNDFIDHYMVKASGEFVKVYLILLRYINDPCARLTISTIADCLNDTERDILRAFNFWEKAGLLHLERDADDKIISIEMETTIPIPDLSTVTPDSDSDSEDQSRDIQNTIPMDSFKAQKEIKSLLFIAEQYLAKTLTKTDIETITYFYDGLGFSADLVEYLIEYCVENGHKSMRYIQTVALSWADKNITTVEDAKMTAMTYNKSCYAVLKAFGIHGRSPAPAEVAYINKWTGEYGFAMDIILEACGRTISATHQPSFEYTDGILANWDKKQVRSLADVERLDLAFQTSKKAKKASSAKKTITKANNFQSRDYDMDSLEEQLLNSN